MDSHDRAPAGGLKIMLGTALLFALVAIYGQWQHLHRPETIRASILPAPNVSPAPTAPNDH